MLKIDSICNLAKSFKTGVKKDAGAKTVKCTLSFSDCPIDRDSGDELLGMSIGWLTATHFDEQGAPLKRFTLSNREAAFRVSATIKGVKGEGALVLLQADLSNVEITLTTNGVILDGTFTWEAAGDEVEDLVPLLDKTCLFVAEVHAVQQELPLRAKPVEGSNVLPFGTRGPDQPNPAA
jgi:hypothetical protein